MFDDFELSRFLGKPVHLFLFTRQGLTWRFATGSRDFLVGVNTYLAAPIERSKINESVERAKNKITIKLAYLRDPNSLEFPVTQSLGDNWHPYVPSDEISVICMATHHGNTEAPRIEWSGVVIQPKFGDVELELTCAPESGVARARNQGPKWQRGCWKTVYSDGPRGCHLDPVLFESAGTVESVDGLVLTSEDFGLDNLIVPLGLSGGEARWTDSAGLLHRRTILSHEGDAIRLSYGGLELASGLSVVVRPNCEQTWAACDARGNTINHGGAHYKPVRNPSGDSMSWG